MSHITGDAVINKDLVSIEYLLDILISIYEWLTSRIEDANNLDNESSLLSSSSTTITTNENIQQQHRIAKYSDLLSTSMSSTNSLINQNKQVNQNKPSSSVTNATSDSIGFKQQLTNPAFMPPQASTIDINSKRLSYSDLEREMENTVKMSQDALKKNLPSSLADLTNTLATNSNASQFQYTAAVAQAPKKQINDDSWINLLDSDTNSVSQARNKNDENNLRSSSTSSFTNGVGVLSEIKRKKQEILEKISFTESSEPSKAQDRKFLTNLPINVDEKFLNNERQQRKFVKFELDHILNSDRSSQTATSKVSDLLNEDDNEGGAYANNQSVQNTTNELSIIRNSIKKNSQKDDKTIRQLLKAVYEDDLKDAESLMRQSLDKVKHDSEMTNFLYTDAHRQSATHVPKVTKSLLIADEYARPISSLKRVEKPKYKARSSSLSPTSRSNNSNNNNNRKSLNKARSQSLLRASNRLIKSTSSTRARFLIDEEGILGKLLEEFPFLYLSPETIHHLWEKHSKQIEYLANQQRELEYKYSNTRNPHSKTSVQLHLEETHKKQKLLMDLMRKEILHMQRVQDLKRKQNVENTLKCKAREQRFQNVKIKNYYEEFRLQQRAKMLKKVTKEEIMFRKLFNESLKIQKERVREMQKYAKEQREIKSRQQLNQIESIENFYKNKFDLLNERLKEEKYENEVREKAQHGILTKLKTQLRSKLESDIRDLQHQLSNDEDFMYWRQLDANRIENDLKFARYKAKV